MPDIEPSICPLLAFVFDKARNESKRSLRPGYSLLCTQPVNRADLPLTTISGLVDCDTFHDTPLNFPARWHDLKFNGVLQALCGSLQGRKRLSGALLHQQRAAGNLQSRSKARVAF